MQIAASPCDGVTVWTSLFNLIAILIPNVAAVVIASMSLWRTRRNGRSIKRVERALNGKVSKVTE